MKEEELREHAKCNVCGKGIGASGLPMFWTVRVERHGLKADAIQRQTGLTMMLGGHAGLARVMGPDEEMTTPLMDPVELTVCETCASPERIIGVALEKASSRETQSKE
jgi:hypothetical protein